MIRSVFILILLQFAAVAWAEDPITPASNKDTGFPAVPDETRVPNLLLPPPEKQWAEPLPGNSANSYQQCTRTLSNQALRLIAVKLPYGKQAWSTYRHGAACARGAQGRAAQAIRCARQVCGFLPSNPYCTLLRAGWVLSKCLPWAGCKILMSFVKPK